MNIFISCRASTSTSCCRRIGGAVFPLPIRPVKAGCIELHVRRVSSGEFTQQLFDGRLEKALLRIEGPLGQFWFRRESPRPALLIGGGTGYAPLRSMLRSLLEVGDRRPLHLYWGAQSATRPV